MSSDSPLDFFSSSLKKKDKGKKNEAGAAYKEAAPSPQAETAEKHSRHSQDYQKVQSMFKEMRQMRANLENQVEALCRTAGMSKELLANIVQETKELSPEQKQFYKNMQADFSAKVWSIVGKGAEKKQPKTGRETSTNSDRRAKTIGSRKRWMPMN